MSVPFLSKPLQPHSILFSGETLGLHPATSPLPQAVVKDKEESGSLQEGLSLACCWSFRLENHVSFWMASASHDHTEVTVTC